jgi:hypothetical protein
MHADGAAIGKEETSPIKIIVPPTGDDRRGVPFASWKFLKRREATIKILPITIPLIAWP